MKKIIIYVLTILIGFLLQHTLFDTLSFASITPNILLIIVASIGFMRGKVEGLLIGFFSGMLIDIFFHSIVGFNALIYMYIGYFNGIFSKSYYPEDVKLPLILILSSDLIFGLSNYVFLFLLRARLDIGYYLLHIIIPEIVYTIIVATIIYPLILITNKKLI